MNKADISSCSSIEKRFGCKNGDIVATGDSCPRERATILAMLMPSLQDLHCITRLWLL